MSSFNAACRVAAALVFAIGCSHSASKSDAGTRHHDAGMSTSGVQGEDENDAGPVETKHVDRSTLNDVGTSGALDYDNPAMWVCRPDIDANECLRNIDATEIASDGSETRVTRKPAQNPAFDCFYVYPTVLLDGSANMTDFSQKGVDLVLDPLLSQAAPFESLCRVYAPFYRQNGLNAAGGGPDGGVGLAAGANNMLAFGDVQDAFNYYLAHLNNGRKFVLLGHSQGSFMLTTLLQMVIDDKPELRAQMISALLLGGDALVPEGQLVGGSFKNIPLCSKPGETGCVIAYNSFAKEAPPPASSAFGRMVGGMQVACTEPAALAGNQGNYKGSYLPTMVNNPSFAANGMFPPDVTTPFALYRDVFHGQCVSANGFTYLEISLDLADGDKRNPPYRSSLLESIGFGLHLVDYNLPLDDLLEAVKQQAAAAK